MSPSVLAILLHVGKVIQAAKDTEKAIADLVAGKPSAADVEAVLEDVINLVTSGLISVPGVTSEQLQQIVNDVKAVVEPAPPVPAA